MPNRLATSNSPYLLQHANNPVDWWPWCDEAFAEARRRDVPVFLSIGYSTCYWCHVMERESFESTEIARRMNEHFVCIKVDREERPDVDDVYMAAVQAFSGRGGWPMSVFLEPVGRRPFYAGTYFPAENKYQGMPSFPQILDGLSNAWKSQRGDVLEQANQLAEAVRERVEERHPPVKLSVEHVGNAVSTLIRMHDRVHGGFGGAPKFPQPVYLDLLLEFREHAREGESRNAVDAVIRKTLDAMACGGIHDHVGGGFHRYSVDEKWIVPHFEKMLYDNAQLMATYAKAAKTYCDEFYEGVTWDIGGYVASYPGMQDELDGFYSAQDAEVNHREGQNYLWTPQQIREVLDADDAEWVIRVFGLDRGSNFRDPHHPNDEPSNVLVLSDRPKLIAEREGVEYPAWAHQFGRVCQLLLAARQKRDQPSLDDKVLASWNGLMIAAIAESYVTLKQQWIASGQDAAIFVLRQMRDAEGGLLRTWRGGTAAIPGFFEDYAFLIQGLIGLERARRDGADEPAKTGRITYNWLAEAVTLTNQAESLFAAGDSSYYDTRAEVTQTHELFVRTRSVYDGALPSPNSVMAHNFIDLAELTGDITYRHRAARLLRALSAHIAGTPAGAANAVRALLRLIVIDPKLVEETFADLPDHASAGASHASRPEVEIEANIDRVEIAPDQPGGLVLRLKVPVGLHINAADPVPGEDARNIHLIPLKVWITGGTGCSVYADYPEGSPYGEGGNIRVHHAGVFELPVIIERDVADGREIAWSGTPLLAVQYQLCSDTECYAPTVVELDVSIERA